jgi:hypothetical protein
MLEENPSRGEEQYIYSTDIHIRSTGPALFPPVFAAHMNNYTPVVNS